MSRRDQILDTAAELFARHGFHGVSIADLGAAVGVSGPALYKHFDSKLDILSAMLVSISEELLAEGRSRVTGADDDLAALAALVDWHTSFALAHPALIVVQDRDWSALPDDARETVRATQREYVEVWVDVLLRLRPDLGRPTGQAMVHATFGLLNSTPHSTFLPQDLMREVLAAMALRGLCA
ncbi:MAG: TetR/AcrR family transcriptional regulator [Nocardioides sp.]